MKVNSVSELTTLTFCVPTALKAQAELEVTALLDRLLDGHAPAQSANGIDETFQVLTPAAAKTLGNSWKLPAWKLTNDAEYQRNRWMVRHCTGDARQSLQLLLESPDRVNTADIADQVGIELSSVPGMLRGISSHCRRVNRRPCWHWVKPKDDPKGIGYAKLDDDLVELLTWSFEHLDG